MAEDDHVREEDEEDGIESSVRRRPFEEFFIALTMQAVVDQKDAVLFVIESSPTMVAWDESRMSFPLKRALDCAYAFLLERIISNPRDKVGVLLYGTRESKNEDQYPSLYSFLPLSMPDARSIKTVRDLIQDEKQLACICEPASERASMANVFFCANKIFSTSASNYTSKRILLVTDEDNPHADDQTLASSAVTRARDLNDLGIKIEPLFISKPDRKFDFSIFYNNIIYRDGEDDEAEDNRTNASLCFDDLLSRVKAKQVPRRAQFSIPLEIGPGFIIGIKGYILFKRQEIRPATWVYTGGNIPKFVKTEIIDVCQTTSMPLKKEDIKKAWKFGGNIVTFTLEEFAKLRSYESPVLRIIGFKPSRMLKFWENLKPSYFIYPSETLYTGSIRTFASLHKKLLADEIMAVAWFIPRRNSAPTFVAMLAVDEELDSSTGRQISPPGIHLITLPFADDLRQNPVSETASTSDELIDKMSAVCNALLLKDFDPSRYSNPSLQWHYQILQAMALEEELPAKADDNTIPKYRLIHKRAGNAMSIWKEELDQITEQLIASTAARKKRKTSPPKEEEYPPARKPR